MEKHEFSKEDFLMYKKYFEKELEKLEIEPSIVKKQKIKPRVHQKHDKTFKEILSNKNEMAQFLKQFIGEEVEKENIEECKNTFITSNFERRESDIIYKRKDKNIYYLIEHQSKVDKEMPVRILRYCVELMGKIENNTEDVKVYPIIIPIVIYTGQSKWNVPTNFSDIQKVEEKYKKYAIDLRYEMIDINKYTKEELIKKDTKLTNMMILEKSKDKKELIQTVLEIRTITKTRERVQWIEKIVEYILSDAIGKETEELIEIIKWEEENEMEDLIERIRTSEIKKENRWLKNGIATGKKEMLIEIIKKMLFKNMQIEEICDITGLTKEEVEKIRNK